MRVVAFDFYPDEKFAAEHCVEFVSIDQLTEQSDFITLHMPLPMRRATCSTAHGFAA